MTAVIDGMDADLLPNDIQQLKALLLQTQAALTVKETELAVKEQETVELASTVSDQQQKLAAKEQQILELLKALRGKQREHVDPCLLYTSPSPRDQRGSRMPSSA